MSEWKEVELSELLSFGNGRTKPESVGNVPIYGGNGILGYSKEFNYENETIIIGRVGAYCGSVYYESNPIWVSDNALAAKAKKGYSTRFLYYFLKNANLNQHAGGSSHPLVTQSLLNSLEFKVCIDENEQRAIASVLSSLDDKIDLLHRQNETLEKMAETLFRQWFLPAGRQGLEEAAKPIEVGVISDLIDFNPSRKVSKGQNAPYLEMSELNTSTYAPSSWYYREFSSGSKFKNGDALLARITPCLENGKAAYIDFLEEEEIGWGSTEFIVMRAKRNLHPFFSYVVTRNDDFKDFAESCMQGSSGRQRVDIDNLKSYEIAIPSPNVIERFNNFCHSIVPKLKSNQDQIRTLTALRDTLLPKLMNGEVRVEINPVETDGRPSLPGRPYLSGRLSLRES